MKGTGESVNILLVEDNPADIRLTAELLRRGSILNSLEVVEDGEEALSYLYKKDKYANSVHPDLILLDLNIPKISGTEVLTQIKGDPDLKRIPVVILTASRAERDIIKSYDSNANAYVTKPLNLEQFAEVLRSIEDFWFGIVTLSPH